MVQIMDAIAQVGHTRAGLRGICPSQSRVGRILPYYHNGSSEALENDRLKTKFNAALIYDIA
jgi:hypothetical protein